MIDDGSHDESPEIAESHPAVTALVKQNNRGVAAARNRGLALADTEFVAFVDQDDLWHVSRVALMLDLASKSGAAAVATAEQVFANAGDRQALVDAGDPRASWPSNWIEDGGELALVQAPLGGSDEVSSIDLTSLLAGAAFVTTAVMYSREAAITAGGCAPFVKAADDHVLNVNIARIFGPIMRVDRPALFYRIHPGATTNRSPLVLPLLTLQLALRHGRSLPTTDGLGPNLEHLISQIGDQEELSRTEQLSLLTLITPRAGRPRRYARWARSVVRGNK